MKKNDNLPVVLSVYPTGAKAIPGLHAHSSHFVLHPFSIVARATVLFSCHPLFSACVHFSSLISYSLSLCFCS